MRLLKLEANDPRFRTVRFNRSGISLILGQRKTTEQTPRSRTKTYNGVGKSLLLELIRFCLGSNANEAFKKHLLGWEFSLTIETEDTTHVIRRDAAKPQDIWLGEDKIPLTKLREWLLGASFERVTGIQGLTFRSLFSPFLRSGRTAYERFDRAAGGDGKNDYWPQVRSAFLLGLDLNLVQDKYQSRSRQVLLTKTMKQLESDPLFADLLIDDKAGIELTQLREDESKLEGDLRAFTVAEDHASIQREANSIKKELEYTRKELVRTEEAIDQVSRSLETKGDLNPQHVQRMYAEAKAALPDGVVRTIAEVLKFQRDLIARRVYRLTAEREELERRRSALSVQTISLAAALDQKIKYLGTHIALDEYLSVSEKLNELRQRIAKLQASKDQRERVSRQQRTLALELAAQAIKTDDYLERATPLIEEANQAFRRFSRPLYGGLTTGIAVTTDNGGNNLRYKIEAHIPRDAAEGINEAKIFCWDLMVLTLRRRHRIDFLAHDSTLFSPVDQRQRLTMLQMASEVANFLGLQYIATLNEHDVTSMVPTDTESAAAFAALFAEPNVVLRLTDQAPRERLLGFDVDMNYWEKSDTRQSDTEAEE